eukprot:11163595-Lingulodinium_polyedra.AAC.1
MGAAGNAACFSPRPLVEPLALQRGHMGHGAEGPAAVGCAVRHGAPAHCGALQVWPHAARPPGP